MSDFEEYWDDLSKFVLGFENIKYSKLFFALIIKFMIGAFFIVVTMNQFQPETIGYIKIYDILVWGFTILPYIFYLFMVVTIGEIGVYVITKIFAKLLAYTRMLNDIKNERKKLENES